MAASEIRTRIEVVDGLRLKVEEVFERRVRSRQVSAAVIRRRELPGFGVEERDFASAEEKCRPALAPNEVEIFREKVAAASLLDSELSSFTVQTQEPVSLFGKKVDKLESLFNLLEKEDLKPSDLTQGDKPSSAKQITVGDRGFADREESTVRVTNLAEHVEEAQLHQLMSTVGPVQKVFIPKNDYGQSKGFAFVTYRQRSHGAAAIAKFQRFGFENLIINVDWAQPAKRNRI
ncbi:MAG: hypothetical protein KVP17_003662 [Porospora cf. gigantea B]|uniref:uncharacterized protein n=1 Tax=Porospora cf. gigantea B TaxID=2853592 RepID=UPI0035719A30|nr:MAG: hypothetical protein KVP17_003662 [Porospora cf. gigantea B]